MDPPSQPPTRHRAPEPLSAVRALWFAFHFWPAYGGGEIINTALSRGLVRRGHTVEVITDEVSGFPASDAYEGIPIRRFPFHAAIESGDPAQLLAIGRDLRAIVARYRPHVVHLHTLNHVAFFCRRALEGSRVPLCLTRHEMFPVPPGPGSVPAWGLERADWIACCSKAALDDVLRYQPDAAERASIILNGLTVPASDPLPPPTGAPVLLGLGRLNHQKGFDLLVEAFAQVRFARPEARLIVAGEGPDRAALEGQVRRLGLDGSVAFPGWLPPDRVPEAISRSSVVLVPSREGEAFGLVALQAAQMARPVVVTRVGGLPEVVGDAGVIVDPENPAALARAALGLLEQPQEAARLGRAARERALSLFSAERQLDAYDALYRRLAGTSDD